MVIFAKLVTQPIVPSQFLLVLAMMGTVLACLAVSWGLGAMMKLEPKSVAKRGRKATGLRGLRQPGCLETGDPVFYLGLKEV